MHGLLVVAVRIPRRRAVKGVGCSYWTEHEGGEKVERKEAVRELASSSYSWTFLQNQNTLVLFHGSANGWRMSEPYRHCESSEATSRLTVSADAGTTRAGKKVLHQDHIDSIILW
jgi:hypothetical protein